MRSVSPLIVFSMITLALAGCQSRPQPRAVTRVPAPAAPQPPPAEVAPVSPSPALSTLLWVSAGDWLKAAGNGSFSESGTPDKPVFLWKGTLGKLILRVGSRVATWNGRDFWLGQGPQLLRGELSIVRTDFEKSLLPLLSGPEALRRPRIVVIDPGHGGGNEGTGSVIGQQHEKEFTLDWALRVRKALAGYPIKVVLTRTNDLELSLPERTSIADKSGADLFVSLHFNSGSPNGRQEGIETYCLTPTGLPSTLTREFPDDSSAAFPNNAFDIQNFTYALRFQHSLLRATGGVDRGVRRARFMGVLRFQNRPAILIEGGYLSNGTEARKIHDPAYRQKLADAVADVISGRVKVLPPVASIQDPAMK